MSELDQTCDTRVQVPQQEFNKTCNLDLREIHNIAVKNIGGVRGTGESDFSGSAFKQCNAIGQCAWVTAHHVVAGGNPSNMEIVTSDGVPHPFSIVGGDKNNDISILRVPGDEQTSPERPGLLPRLDLTDNGEPVVGVGHAAGLSTLMYSPGKVTNPNLRVKGMECVVARSIVAGGQSGGPAFDAQGKVVGLVSNGKSGETCYAAGNRIMAALEKVFKRAQSRR
jgi:hypothetical protein